MYLGFNYIIPPKEWYHDPKLKDKNGATVAMCIGRYKMDPPKEWVI